MLLLNRLVGVALVLKGELEVAVYLNLVVNSRVRVEKLIGSIGSQHQDPVLQILLLDVLNFLVHQDGLGEALKFQPGLTLDFGVNLQKHL